MSRPLSRLQARPVAAGDARDQVAAAPDAVSERGLVVSGVSKRLPRQDRAVLDGVSLTLERGETASISGPNGAGKTSFLRVLAGLVRPDSGTIRFDSLDSEDDRRRYRARVGFLSAGNAGLFARLSVDRHLEYAASLALLRPDEGRRAVDGARDAFALHDLRSRRVDRLSMGQRQRVRAALAFLHSPDLLLLDEAHTSLDGEGMALLRKAVAAATERGAAAVSCSPAGLMEGGVFDHRFLMRDGRLTPR